MPMLTGLKRRPEFLRVAASGRKVSVPGLVLQVAPRVSDRGAEGRIAGEIGVGYTVSRKVGGAVQRNRARRRLRAVVRKIMQNHARPGFDYVLIGRTGTVTRPFDLLVSDLKDALGRLGAWVDRAQSQP